MNYFTKKFAGSVALAGALVFTSVPVWAQDSASDAQIQADVTKALDKKEFKDVQVNVHNGMVQLTGTVDLYAAKEDADRKVHHRKNVKAIDNEIKVAGPTVEDATLKQKLSEKLTYLYIGGGGTTQFDAFTLQVQNGVATVGGVAYGPVDKDSALSLVANYPGVKDVVDNVQVAPLSNFDDRIRIAEARSIYSMPQLSRYAIDPAKPIRIVVINGNVTLAGMVDSQSDKDVAGIRANSVPGVFKVTNDLMVAQKGPRS